LDWRRSGGDPSESRLLDNLWRKLVRHGDETDPRLEAVRSVAIYQPRQALEFIQHQFDQGRTPPGVAGIVRNIAYNFDYLEEACELLWALGRDDRCQLGPNLDHPIRILSELCGFEEIKPLIFTERVFDFAMQLLDNPDAWSHIYSPLDILKPVLSTEGITTTSRGRHFQISPFLVDYSLVAPLRRRLIDRVIELLRHAQPKIACRAAEFLEYALRAPMGLMGSIVGSDLYGHYQLEIEQTISKLEPIVASGDLRQGVMIAIARSVSWHAQYGPPGTSGAAHRVMAALPATIGFRTCAVLADGYGRVFLGRWSLSDWQDQLNDWMAGLVQELRTAFPDKQTLRAHLESALTDLEVGRNSEDSPYVLVSALLQNDAELGRAFIADAEFGPPSATRRFVGLALQEVLCSSPNEGREKARRFLASGERDLAFAAVSAMGGLRRPVETEDVEILRPALASSDVGLALAAVRALWFWRNLDTRVRLELAKLVEIGTSARLADELCMMFAGVDRRLLDALDRADVDHLLQRLLDVPQLEGHWLEQLLVDISFRYPHALAEFFFKRVDLAASEETFGDFRPANYGPYAHARLRIDESAEAASVLQRTWAWLRQNEHRDEYFQYNAANVFNAMFLSVDNAMVALFEAKLESASKAELALMARLLRNARPGFIFHHRQFVVRYLERCRDAGKDLLHDGQSSLLGSAISGIRSGPVGEPTAQDVKMVAAAKEASKHVSRLSPAYRLYDDVKRSGEARISRSRRDGEALDDQ